MAPTQPRPLPNEAVLTHADGAEAAYTFLDIERDEDAQEERWRVDLKAWQRRRERARGGAARHQDDPKPVKPSRTSIRAFARQTPYDPSTICKHVRSIRQHGRPHFSGRRTGRPRLLLDWEDAALVRYASQLRGGPGPEGSSPGPAFKTKVVTAANKARRLRGQTDVGEHWFTRWMNYHPELSATDTKPVEDTRVSKSPMKKPTGSSIW